MLCQRVIRNNYVSFYSVFTDFLLSKALQERDDQTRRMREEATQAQKRFQQLQEEDRAQQVEVRERLEHLNRRKEELKQQLADKETELDEASKVHRQVFYIKVKETLLIHKLHHKIFQRGLLKSFGVFFLFFFNKKTLIYNSFHTDCSLPSFIWNAFSFSIFCTSEAIKKWQEKTDLLTRLESQVKRMKENFDAKELLLLEERNKATEAQKYETESQITLIFFVI